MEYKKLVQMYNDRQEKLQGLLDDSTLSLHPERTQQIRGAIDEIGMFVSVLEQYQKRSSVVQNSELAGVHSIKGANRTGVLRRMVSFVF